MTGVGVGPSQSKGLNPFLSKTSAAANAKSGHKKRASWPTMTIGEQECNGEFGSFNSDLR